MPIGQLQGGNVSLGQDEKHSQIDVRENWAGDYLFNQYPDGVLIIAADGTITDINDTFIKLTGYEKSDLLGKRMEVLMPKGSGRAKHVCLRKQYNKNPTKRGLESGIEPELLRKDGTTFPVDLMLSPLKTNDGMFVVTLVRDITEKQKILKKERDTQQALNAVFNSAPVAIFSLSKDLTVLSWSKEAERLFGYNESEVVGKPYKLLPPRNMVEREECASLIDKVFEGETVYNVRRQRLHKNGSLVKVSISAAPMFDEEGNVYAATYCAQDISEQLEYENKLNKLAYFDQLTNLPNAACLQKDVEEQLSNIVDGDIQPISLAIIELKGFREVNNTLGRSSGDKLIKQVVDRIKNIDIDSAKLYRTGSYEFSIALPQCGDPRIVTAMADKIIEKLQDPFEIDNQIAHVSANIGITIAPLHGRNYEDLLANCSLALGAAKMDSVHNVKFFSMSIRTAAQASRELDIDLRRAFEANEFELFYQPQIDLVSENIIGVEALLRWRHPEHGIIPPGGFIDALGRNPIAYDVGKWILREAVSRCANWRKKGLGDLRIGANLFAAQFENNLAKDVEDALSEFDLPARLLELEITENIALDANKKIIKPLKEIKKMGVSLAFDDFGTGFASLSYLMHYPLTRIKIDKSFLVNIPQSTEKKAIVHSLIAMAHGLDLEVIAEGVETKEHIKFLQHENCEEAQGFYYSKPLEEKEFIDFVSQYMVQNSPSSSKQAI